MHKFYIRIIALLCVIAMLPLLAGCKSEKQEEETATEEYHTITFNSNGGTPIDPIQVHHGHHASRPDDPVLSNYIFCRWEMPDGRTWFFDIKKVDSDITLEAIWIKAEQLFDLEPIPDSSNIMITKITRQEEFSILKVPSVINGKTVVAIGEGAFESIHETYASNIIFPETVTHIDAYAFKGASGVSITFNGAITYLGESAFESSDCISVLTLGEGLESIPYRAFANCTTLATVDIPKGVTLIDENAFENCSSMVTIVIPETLTAINNSAFDECSALKTVFYRGTPEQLDTIEIAGNNDYFEEANFYFYSEEEPADEGNYWHYGKNGTPIIW